MQSVKLKRDSKSGLTPPKTAGKFASITNATARDTRNDTHSLLKERPKTHHGKTNNFSNSTENFHAMNIQETDRNSSMYGGAASKSNVSLNIMTGVIAAGSKPGQLGYTKESINNMVKPTKYGMFAYL